MKNTAIFTHTPLGRKIKQDLLADAEHVGHILMESRGTYYQAFTLTPFSEITHYFNKDMKEVGMIAFAFSPVETVLIHDPPRMWSPEFLKKSQIRENRWNKRFDAIEV